MTGPPGDRPGTPVYVMANYGAEEEVDLRDYLRVLVTRRRLIAGFVLVCTLVSVVVSLLLTPMYRATALISPVREEENSGLSSLMNQFGGLASLAGISPSIGDDTEERIAIFTSRAFTARIVKENDLMPQLFPELWDAGRKAWKVSGDDVPTQWDAYRKFENIREVSEDHQTGLVTVSIEWTDPETAARWVTLHVDTLNRYLQAEAIREANDSIAYLMRQVDQTSNVELRQTLFNLVEAQTKKAMLARVRDDFAFKVIDPAVAPDRRYSPRRKLIVAFTFVASALLAVFLAFALEFLRRGRAPEADAKPASGAEPPSDPERP